MKIICLVLLSTCHAYSVEQEVTFNDSLFTKEFKTKVEIGLQDLNGIIPNDNHTTGDPIPMKLFQNLCKHCKEVNLSTYDEDTQIKDEIVDMGSPSLRTRRTLNRDKTTEWKLTLFEDPLSNIDADLAGQKDGDALVIKEAEGSTLLEIVAKEPILVTMEVPKAADENIGTLSFFEDPLSKLEIDEKRWRNETKSFPEPASPATLSVEGSPLRYLKQD